MKENLSEVGKAHEKELADMNAANAVLKAQLEKALAEVKDLQQQTSAMGASLEESEDQTASAKAAIQAKDAQVDVLKRRLAEMEKESGKTPDEDKASASKERLSEVGKAHENELEVMNAAKEKELADQKAENAALKSQFEKALQAQQTENDNLKRSTTELLKECKGFEADILAKGAEIERFKTQMAEQEKSHIIASGKEEIEALKDQVSALEKQLKEMEDSKNSETMTVDKDQTKQLKARVVVLNREVEGAELVSEHELVRWKIYVKIMQY
jgi:chromosome segregation ATPase